jgi:hypothetical protein
LKNKVLAELAASGEVEKFHSVTEAPPGFALLKRHTKSKAAMQTGGVDVWQWRLTGPQAETPEPQLEEEPLPDSYDWYLPNSLFPPTIELREKKFKKKDPYGAAQWDHLNTRRENVRPKKEQREKEWVVLIFGI